MIATRIFIRMESNSDKLAHIADFEPDFGVI